jgi:hypothetical protein
MSDLDKSAVLAYMDQFNAEVRDSLAVGLDSVKAALAAGASPVVLAANIGGAHYAQSAAEGCGIAGVAIVQLAQMAAELDEARAEVERLRAKLDQRCGSCHPCTYWPEETWRREGRTPPHAHEWDSAVEQLRKLRDELTRLTEAGVETGWRRCGMCGDDIWLDDPAYQLGMQPGSEVACAACYVLIGGDGA